MGMSSRLGDIWFWLYLVYFLQRRYGAKSFLSWDSRAVPTLFGGLSQSNARASAGILSNRNWSNVSFVCGHKRSLDPTIKAEKMQEWWSKAHELLIGLGLKRSDIVDAVAQSDIRIRDDSVALINYCRENQIPFLLFSAGLGDVLAVVSLHGSH